MKLLFKTGFFQFNMSSTLSDMSDMIYRHFRDGWSLCWWILNKLTLPVALAPGNSFQRGCCSPFLTPRYAQTFRPAGRQILVLENNHLMFNRKFLQGLVFIIKIGTWIKSSKRRRNYYEIEMTQLLIEAMKRIRI